MKLAYVFQDKLLLKQALTHRSAHACNNERLEFLGDAILSVVIASALYAQYPEKNEGSLSRLRACLVKEDRLAVIAKQIQLGDSLFLGQGELKSGGFRRASILADALEAVFGAIFLDGGFIAAEKVILSLYQPYLNDPNLLLNLVDAKTQLQEYLQAKKIALPEYALISISGDEHEQYFRVSCSLSSLKIQTEGSSDTRRRAEQIAAKEMLKLL